MSPPLRAWPLSSVPVLLAVMLPSTLMVPPSASRCTAPPCSPVVSMRPLCNICAAARFRASACMYTCPPSDTMAPLFFTLALMSPAVSSSLMRPLPVTGTLIVSAAPNATPPLGAMILPSLLTLAPSKAT
ncbi:MAG: hypothetical protein WBK09_05830 [Limnohabitans sp.]|uniref:hypothetical protein n=1 Tax=Limnohabitans sp. TaxID=1907725 RepID=UPI003C795399